jgi:DNA-directed RNA polymerase subunit RPC12/RpoP
MTPEEQSHQWHQESEPTFVHIAQWRQAHPQATMAEIEEAVDAQMQTLRAHLLQEAAHAAPTPHPTESADAEKPRCPDCKVVLQARGKRERHLQTHGGKTVSLKRTYLSCPRCGYGLFPPG